MVVAAGTTQGQPKKHRPHGFHPVHDVFRTPLLFDCSAFCLNAVIPVESGSHDLVIAGIWHEISRQLPRYKLIVGLVGIEGFNNPVPPRPLSILKIIVIAVTVSIPCPVQPPRRHALPVTGRTQQTIHNLAVRFMRTVREKSIHLFDTRRKSREIDRHAPDEFFLRGFLLQFESSHRKRLLHEGIDSLHRPSLHVRKPSLNRGPERPVTLVPGPFPDPPLDNVLLGIS